MSTLFRQLSTPWFHPFIGSRADFTEFCWSIASKESDLALRVVRGSRMTTFNALDSEVSAAFQFPDYFGENWAAFSECLTDLSWLPAGAYLMAIRDTAHVLSDETTEDFATFFRILRTVAQEWSTPVARGEWWDRPGKPFHFLLHAIPEESERLHEIVRLANVATD